MTLHQQLRHLANTALQRPGVDFVKSLLRSRPGHVIDVGANDGGFIGMWLESGATLVTAFEPVPWIFEKLAKNWAHDARVQLAMAAIGDSDRIVNDARILNAHTLARPKDIALELAVEDRGPFSFQVISIDNWMASVIGGVSLIKIDVDGHEPLVIKGAMRTILGARPIIMLELSYLPIKLGHSVDTMIMALYENGYKICTMAGEVCEDPLIVLEAFPWRTSFDVVAVPNSMVKDNWPRIE